MHPKYEEIEVFFSVYIICTVPCFSANKPTYTSGAYQSAQRAVVTPKSHTPVQASSAATYVYPANTSQPVSTYSTTTYATNTTASATYTGKGNCLPFPTSNRFFFYQFPVMNSLFNRSLAMFSLYKQLSRAFRKVVFEKRVAYLFETFFVSEVKLRIIQYVTKAVKVNILLA